MSSPAYYLVVDVEATCSADESVPRNEMEIIEIGAVLVEALTLDAIDEFQEFVQPVRHPRLTPFCTDLTTIRQVDVTFAPRFPAALEAFNHWLRPYRDALFCSWGAYDRIQFERDCTYHRVAYPFGRQHLNLKQAFASRQRLVRPVGLPIALRHLNLPQTGTAHRGIDDARNIARLLPFIIA